MASVKFTAALCAEYEGLFRSCIIRAERFSELDEVCGQVLRNRTRYKKAVSALSVPWYFVAAVHSLETSLRFDRHFHNGDPLTGRTVRVPRGRPAAGSPPFTWEESLLDALRYQNLTSVKDWTVGSLLYRLERYNGFGYRLYHPEVRSPYLWAGTEHYTRGKYVADGRFSPTAVSAQIGAAALLRRLVERNEVTLVYQRSASPDPLVDLALVVPVKDLRYSLNRTPWGEALQRWLNGHPGVALRVDGIPGPLTSDAYRTATGDFLPGDPRKR